MEEMSLNMSAAYSGQSSIVRDDFEEYTNDAGFVSRAPDSTSGNDLLYSCIAAILMMKHGVWDPEDAADFHAAILGCRIEPGLYARPGWEQDQIGPDDMIGLLAWSYKQDPNIADAILDYGRKGLHPLDYYYPSAGQSKFDIRAWLGRSPSWIAHLEWAAGEKPGWIRRLAWAFSVAFSGKRDQHDEWILSWLLITVAGDRGWIERWATQHYYKRLSRIFPSGLKDVFALYFKDAAHPLSKHWLP